MGFTVLFGTGILIVMDRQDMTNKFQKIDWNLLVFFASLFILVSAFDSQFFDTAWSIMQPFLAVDGNALKILIFTVMLLVGSNILSNVPLVLLLSTHLTSIKAPIFTWLIMAFVTTVAGNFTLIGSVANLIVAEKAKRDYAIGFWEYFKFGALSTVLVTAVGVPLVVALSP